MTLGIPLKVRAYFEDRAAVMSVSNSWWLGVINLVWCSLYQVMPLFADHPKVILWLLVGSNLLAMAYKFLTGTLPKPDLKERKS